MMAYLCGCYYFLEQTNPYTPPPKQYLPLLDSEVHSTILSTTSRTVLKQTFTNPSTESAIKKATYTFPLYDGVSVVSFTCTIGKKVLTGLVKEKVKAKEIFDQAVARGETAGYLEQAPEASDVFSTKLGNIPAGESVVVEITYIGELKHHETDGIRFTIPTKIAPRYGNGPVSFFGSSSQAHDQSGIKIVVDVELPDGSFIKGVQSPSHPIAVSLGAVSTAADVNPVMSKASATLSLGNAALDKDFVLIVESKDTGTPKAILETHPTIPNHRALMATLVPKFTLPPSRPEIVFVADRSGSMGGNIPMLKSAMNVFLKSMPTGVKFNICSFGSSHSFLWEKSQSYTKETLNHAINHVGTFGANMGGTETFSAIKGTIERRYADLPLEIILLTDGDIWQQNDLFAYVNDQVEKSKGNIRIFPLGIGNGVSHSLIEGLARAGNGFAQAVQHGERLENSVVRMLRGALSPHITDYTLEVKYENDDGFELIEKVTDSMKVLLSASPEPKTLEAKVEKPTISLFDTAAKPELQPLKGLKDSVFWLPDISLPKLLQAPHKIPSLFSFSRTSVYILMSPETIQRNPVSVVLRATSSHGPLALEIPVEVLATPGETIHQLAAKKAVQDLEEGRGWIYDAKDENGKLVKERYPSRFDECVQREAVRLGEKFQIAGKWCAFVAVTDNDEEIALKKEKNADEAYDPCCEYSEDLDEDFADIGYAARGQIQQQLAQAPMEMKKGFKLRRAREAAKPMAMAYSSPPKSSSPATGSALMSANATGAFGSFVSHFRRSDSRNSTSPPQPQPNALYSPSPQAVPPPPPPPAGGSIGGGLFGRSVQAAQAPPPPGSGLFGSSSMTTGKEQLAERKSSYSQTSHSYKSSGSSNAFISPSYGAAVTPQDQGLFGSPRGGAAPTPFAKRKSGGFQSSSVFGATSARYAPASPPSQPAPAPKNDYKFASVSAKVLALIALQDFEGFWEFSEEVQNILGLEIEKKFTGEELKIWITSLVVKFLEVKCGEERGTWELVVDKAQSWLEGLGMEGVVREMGAKAEGVVKGH